MDANTWFYTFSTSAQVMAALVGLFAVFVVYKIQDFSQLINDARQGLLTVIPYVSANTAGYETITNREFVQLTDKQILERFAELLAVKTPNSANTNISIGQMVFTLDDGTYDYFKRLVDRKSRILRRLLIVLCLTLASIALSLICLALTVYLINTWVIYGCSVFFLFCLWTIGKDIYQIAIE